MIIKLDFDVCKGGRVQGRKVIGMRYNYKDIYSLIGNYNAYTVEITESGAKTVIFDVSSEYYYSAIDPYFDMGDGAIFYDNIFSYTYTTPGTYLIITSARIDRTLGGTKPDVIAINGIRRDTIHLDNAFINYGCLKEFIPENISTKRVISAKRVFYNCSSGSSNKLELLNLSNWNTSSLTDMSEMFRIESDTNVYNSKFLTIDMSGWDTSNVLNMSGTFYGNDYLNEVLGISNWNTSNVIDMSEMFYRSGLDTLDIGNWKTDNVITFKNMFYGSEFRCKSYYFDENNAPVYIPPDLTKWDTSSATDMSGMFYECRIASLDLNNWKVHNVADMNSMFSGCNKLESLGLSNWNTSNVVDMGGMFESCPKLASLDLSSFNTSEVTDMSYMFYDCNNLTSLDLRSFDTSKVSNTTQMLYNCSNLTELRLDNCSKETIRTIIKSQGFPTGDAVSGNPRIIHVKSFNEINGITKPEGWEWEY